MNANILGGKQRAVFKNRPSEFFRNSDGSYFRRIDYEHAIYPCRGLLHPGLGVTPEPRPIGKWGRIHRDYLRENKPIQYNCLLLSGRLWTYLADLDEQAQDRLERIIDQMKATEGITEALKAIDPMAWVQHMNNIRTRAEEIVREELIYV